MKRNLLQRLLRGSKQPTFGPFPNPDSRKNVKAPTKPLKKKDIDYERNKKEITAHFKRQHDALTIVKTTTTPKGQTIDWIPIGSQGTIATAPPSSLTNLELRDARHNATQAIPELAMEGVEKGPEGTVPILRKNLEKLGFTQSLDMYLSKTKGNKIGSTRMLAASFAGVHRYANSTQSVTNYGGQGVISGYSPYVQSSSDFSLLQIGCLSTSLGYYQTVEVGWQVYQEVGGDFSPHLFTYYTNNGYQQQGDNQGGYNRDVKGWVQVDSTIFPGSTFTPYSVPGGTQEEIGIKVQQYQGNWWVNVQNTWIGYYPGSLYNSAGHEGSSMPDHADVIGWWGEVYDSEGRTTTDMGSGLFPGANDVGHVAYMRNLQFQRDAPGSMADYNGAAGNSDPDMYQIDAHFNSGTTWGSYAWIGGPGAG